jgi:hypothetical protein
MSNGRSYKEKKKQIKTQTHKQLNHAGAPKGSFGRACSGSQGTSAPGRKFPYTRETQGYPPETVIYSCPFGQQSQGMQWKARKQAKNRKIGLNLKKNSQYKLKFRHTN